MDNSRFECYKSETEQFLKKYLDSKSALPQSILYDAMGYSLLAGGKRLRPLLTCEFARLVCGDWKRAIPFACALEMIHTYSLIHDDLPCMDNDDYRRGRLTNHKVYGEAIAVLAGDALLTDALAIAASTEHVSASALPRAVQILAQCAGSDGMVGGQVLDILSEDRICTEQEVMDIQTRKTGCLIQAACMLGALAGDADDKQLHAAHQYAYNLGLAFQIRDDILDQIGSQDELGKAIGVDANKNTFVRMYGVERCDELVREYTQKAQHHLAVFSDIDELKQLSLELTVRRV